MFNYQQTLKSRKNAEHLLYRHNRVDDQWN